MEAKVAGPNICIEMAPPQAYLQFYRALPSAAPHAGREGLMIPVLSLSSMSPLGRGCVKTRKRRVFEGPLTLPEVSIAEYKATCKVAFSLTLRFEEFLHRLGREPTSGHPSCSLVSRNYWQTANWGRPGTGTTLSRTRQARWNTLCRQSSAPAPPFAGETANYATVLNEATARTALATKDARQISAAAGAPTRTAGGSAQQN
jgi:hypothetical protein